MPLDRGRRYELRAHPTASQADAGKAAFASAIAMEAKLARLQAAFERTANGAVEGGSPNGGDAVKGGADTLASTGESHSPIQNCMHYCIALQPHSELHFERRHDDLDSEPN